MVYIMESWYASYCGQGGSQTAGGSAGSSGGLAGSWGTGGAAYATYGGGGGGGGYYGGGGGYEYGGGGGGSNYITTTGTSNIVRYQGVNSGSGKIIISYNLVTCVSGLRTPVTITVSSISTAPSSVTASPSTVACGYPTTLSATDAGYFDPMVYICCWRSPSRLPRQVEWVF